MLNSQKLRLGKVQRVAVAVGMSRKNKNRRLSNEIFAAVQSRELST